MNIEPIDIVARLLRRRHIWPQRPEIRIEGRSGQRGFLILDFGDEIIGWSIWIRDKEQLRRTAEEAIDQFGELAFQLYAQG